MKPHFERYAEEYGDRAYFRTVNIREQPKIAKVFKVSGLPNFKFVLQKKVVEGFRGADADAFLRHLKKAVHRADKEEVRLSAADLVDFFRKHDPEIADSPESIQLLLEQGSTDFPAMLEMLKTQYGATPRYTGGFIPREAAAQLPEPSAPVAPETCRPGSAVTDISTEELETELARRRAAATAAQRAAANPCATRRQAERVVIIGGGPAGLAAALYAARGGLCPVVVAPAVGGQLMMKGVDVENYPGLARAGGRDIVLDMRAQAESFHAEVRDGLLMAADLSRWPFTLRMNESDGGVILTEALIIATGSSSRWLGVPGEEELRGRGVSGCATCDGYLYHGQACLVVGGGDSALEDALMLLRICSNVTLVHRRDAFRASRVLQDRVLESSISIRWNTEVAEFLAGSDGLLSQVLLRARASGATAAVDVGAAFLAVGHTPNTAAFQGQLAMDDAGYVHTEERTTRTSVPGVFAAGDVADPIYRQAVTSAGSGAQAALDAGRWLSEQGVQLAGVWAGGEPLPLADLGGGGLPELRAPPAAELAASLGGGSSSWL